MKIGSGVAAFRIGDYSPFNSTAEVHESKTHQFKNTASAQDVVSQHRAEAAQEAQQKKSVTGILGDIVGGVAGVLGTVVLAFTGGPLSPIGLATGAIGLASGAVGLAAGALGFVAAAIGLRIGGKSFLSSSSSPSFGHGAVAMDATASQQGAQATEAQKEAAEKQRQNAMSEAVRGEKSYVLRSGVEAQQVGWLFGEK